VDALVHIDNLLMANDVVVFVVFVVAAIVVASRGMSRSSFAAMIDVR
jgi:hypothetical protein